MAVEPHAGGSPQALGALVVAEHDPLSGPVKLIGIKPECRSVTALLLE
jgi:hypothetical protein